MSGSIVNSPSDVVTRLCQRMQADFCIRPSVSWLTQAITSRALKQEAGQAYTINDDEALALLLTSSLSDSCPGGSALPDVGAMHNEHIHGTFLVEVVTVANIAEPAKTRQKLTASKTRCLKFILTDGKQTVEAFEYRPLRSLRPEHLGQGAKIVLCGEPYVRHGIIYLDEGHVQPIWGGTQGLGPQQIQLRDQAHTTSTLTPAQPLSTPTTRVVCNEVKRQHIPVLSFGSAASAASAVSTPSSFSFPSGARLTQSPPLPVHPAPPSSAVVTDIEDFILSADAFNF
eukprot:GHVT01033829.1.p1 GENE.GHVT01033829.1~~GHVT01033829.1.p1  ORF type:complete len:285 (+),score=25.50 GHVT01033829.1:755-1609(+)